MTVSTARIDKVGTVMVPVKDQDEAIAFYTGKLGFELSSDTPFGDGNRWIEVVPPGAATTVALTMERPEQWPAGSVTNIAFSTEDIDAVHAHLQGQGVDVDAEIMRMGDPVPPMFWFRDPWGNTLLVVEQS